MIKSYLFRHHGFIDVNPALGIEGLMTKLLYEKYASFLVSKINLIFKAYVKKVEKNDSYKNYKIELKTSSRTVILNTRSALLLCASSDWENKPYLDPNIIGVFYIHENIFLNHINFKIGLLYSFILYFLKEEKINSICSLFQFEDGNKKLII